MKPLKFTRNALAVLSALMLLALGWAAEAPRTALLDFVMAKSPGATEPTVLDFSRAVQAKLQTSADFAWVERQEFERITREAALGEAGQTSAASAVRLGHLLRADLVLQGEIARRDDGKGDLMLEVVDLKRAEVLATRTVALALEGGRRFRPGATDVKAVSDAALAALVEAKQALRQAENARVIAPLYFKNISKTERLGYVEERLKAALAQAATPATGTRVLHFPRVGEGGEESSLVLSGLTDTDPDAWQHVADVYLWGTIAEEGTDGMAFEEVPVKIAVQLWDGTGEAREVVWRGPVKELERGVPTLTRDVLAAVKAGSKGGARNPEERKRIAESLKKRADEVWAPIVQARLRPPTPGFSYSDILASAAGRQLFAYRLKLLETACFFDPLNRTFQQDRLAAAWTDNPLKPLDSLRGQWLRLADYQTQLRRFGRQPEAVAAGMGAANYTTLCVTFAKLLDPSSYNAKRYQTTPDDIQQQFHRVTALWSETVNGAMKGETGVPPTDEDRQRWVGDFRELLDKQHGDLVHHRAFVESVWPVLQKPIGTWLKSSNDGPQRFVNQLYSIYDGFGEFDRAAAMLDAAWKSGAAARVTEKENRPIPRRIDPPWAPQNRNGMPMIPGMSGMPATPSAPALAATVREIETWPGLTYYQAPNSIEDLRKPFRHIIDTLVWQDGKLWIGDTGPAITPEVGPANPQGNHYVWRYDPALHAADYVTPQLGGHSALRGLLPVGSDLWLAFDVDGVWRRPAGGQPIKRFTAEDGLTSPRISLTQATADALYFLGGTMPNFFVNRYSLADGKWSGIQVPPSEALPGGMQIGGANDFYQPQMALFGDWLCVAAPTGRFYNLKTNEWSDLLSPPPPPVMPPGMRPPPAPAAPSKPSARLFTSVSADENGFWLGMPGRLIFVDPKAPTVLKELTLADTPQVAVHHGPWLWLIVDDQIGRSSLLLVDKRTMTPVGTVALPEGRRRKLVATDDRLWVGGWSLVEIVLKEPRASGAPPAGTMAEAKDYALLRAVRKGDVAAVKTVLATKPDVNAASPSGWTPLLTAVEDGRADLAELLLNAGANPNVVTPRAAFALGIAAKRGDVEMTTLLLKHGANPNVAAKAEVRGFRPARNLVADVAMVDASTPPPQPTGLKATVTEDGSVALSWVEHADAKTRYQVTCDNRVVATLPAGQARWVHKLPPYGAGTVNYRVDAFNLASKFRDETELGSQVAVAVPKAPPANVYLFNTGSAGPIFMAWATQASPALHAAAAGGHEEVVKILLTQKADPNSFDATDTTPLIAAVRAGHYGVARLLLAAGAEAGAMNSSDESAVAVAYDRHDNEAFFRELVSALPANERAREASTLILEAARRGAIKDIELLRSLGGEIDGVTEFGESALSRAVGADQVETANWLLDQNFPVTRKVWLYQGVSSVDRKVLEAAVQRNRRELFTRLLDAGCDPNQHIEGDPLVVVAAKKKSFAVLDVLCARGADLNRKGTNGKVATDFLTAQEAKLYLGKESEGHWPTPTGKAFGSTVPGATDPAKQALTEQLIAACKAGDMAGVIASIKTGVDLDQISEDGRTPLHHALMAQHADIARRLIEEGASVNAISRGGNTPLNFAIQNGQQPEMIDYLLRAGANPHIFGLESYPALYAAVITKNHAAVKRLLDAGASVNLQGNTDSGQLASPLAMALRKGDDEVVNWLLSAGANPRAQNYGFVHSGNDVTKYFGPSLLMYAAGGGSVTLIKQMIALGQDPKFRADKNEDALTWAAWNGKKEAVEFLLPLSELKGPALARATRNNRTEVVEVLRKAGYQE